MPRNDQITRQWQLLRRLESSRGITLHVRPDGLREKVKEEARKILGSKV